MPQELVEDSDWWDRLAATPDDPLDAEQRKVRAALGIELGCE